MKKRKLKENVVVALHVIRIFAALIQGGAAVWMLWLMCKCNLSNIYSWGDVGMAFAILSTFAVWMIVGNAAYELLAKYE
jgi:predicted membrane protein